MKMMVTGAAMAAALTMGVASAAAVGPAPVAADPEMVCFVAMAVSSGAAREAGEKSTDFDNAGGFYLASVAKRYPTVEQFTPAMSAALDQVKAGDLKSVADKCLAGVQPSLNLVARSIDQMGK